MKTSECIVYLSNLQTILLNKLMFGEIIKLMEFIRRHDEILISKK